MHIYMISYDLYSPTSNRESVEEAIKSLGTWCKYLTTTYLVKSYTGIYDAQDIVTKHLDSNDRLIIAEIQKPILGWLNQDQWSWINQNL